MLAAHREQENRVPSHQAPAKQQPKTPGMRYPKTPIDLGRGNENALAGFAAKNTIQGGINLGENQKFISKKPLVTPAGSRIRAPLGNKTTNAKAINNLGLGIGGKGAVREIEKTQSRNVTSQRREQKQRHRRAQLAPKSLLFKLRDDHDRDQDEPEYAPPNPEPLPYESDVFPRDGLTLKGLEKENLLKGYYEHFYNPVNDAGVSRAEQRLKEEKKAALQKAIEQNEQDTEEFDWNSADVSVELERATPDETEAPERTTRIKKKPGPAVERTHDFSSDQSAMATRASRSGSSGKPVAPARQDDTQSRTVTPSSRHRTTHAAVEHSSPLVLRSRRDSVSSQVASRVSEDDEPAYMMGSPRQKLSHDAASDDLAHLQFPIDSDDEDAGVDLSLLRTPRRDSFEGSVYELRLDV
ncbi:hypothetical protein CCMA1212_002399 [Trichoderma ghanense]|uniref:Uncharacterized protein n=1 Tax=Trichoderma ghanense TaxID=65468 RepID=A0ABY2HBJ3_9HYPO